MGRLFAVGVLCALGCGRSHFEVDADPLDSTSPDAPLANYVFVTSTTHLVSTFGSDLAGADAICMQRASAAGLAGTYRAWLSSSTVNARERLSGARGWYRPDGKPVADRVEDLLAGRMFYPIRVDENGDDIGIVGPEVATGTVSNGGRSFNRCNDCTRSRNRCTASRSEPPAL